MEDKKNRTIEEIHHELENLEKYLQLGEKKFLEAYSKNKERFADLLKQVHEYVSKIEKGGSDKIKEFKESSEYLLQTLETDFDISYIDYSNEPQDILKALENFEEVLKSHYDEITEEAGKKKEDFKSDMLKGIQKFKSELAIQQVHLDHHKREALDDFEDWKQDRLHQIKDLKSKLDTNVKSAEQKFELFTNDIGEAYDALKRAFLRLK